jgi:flagellar biogenesis protein FliO
MSEKICTETNSQKTRNQTVEIILKLFEIVGLLAAIYYLIRSMMQDS